MILVNSLQQGRFNRVFIFGIRFETPPHFAASTRAISEGRRARMALCHCPSYPNLLEVAKITPLCAKPLPYPNISQHMEQIRPIRD